MCGILGIVAEPGEAVGLNRNELIAMRDVMTSRGPDAAGLFERRNMAFGHRRLCIRDLEGGSQPWISEDGQCVLVYNGEIYNDDALRQELTSRGHRFRSTSDTEVVLEAYREWGEDCPRHLNGMFAFGIYDFRDDSLLLVRDRFGIKPLFLTEAAGQLIFASSPAALLKHPNVSRRPCWPAISHYLTTFRLTLGRATMFDGIRQLLPGEILSVHDGKQRIRRYWDYPTATENNPNYGDAVGQLRGLLERAVRDRLVSDVPVGMFLSGGVDSNTIACLVGNALPGRPAARCGGGDNSPDFEPARRCAEQTGFDFDEVRVGPQEYWRCWQEMLAACEMPLSTPTDVILYRLAAEMKKSVGVVLGGEGADELLCGYAVSAWAGHDFDMARQLAEGIWPGRTNRARRCRESLRAQYGRVRFDSPVDHYFSLNSLIPTAAKPRLFQPAVWRQTEEDRPMWNHYRTLLDDQPQISTTDRYARLLHRVNLEGLLSRLDNATMLAGLEARVPYTDHRLVEAMWTLPRRFRIDVAPEEPEPYLASAALERRGTLRSKRVLRSVAETLMPPERAHRPKASFPTPVADWLSGPWADQVGGILLGSEFGRQVFRPAALDELADHIPQAGMWLWPLVNLLTWGDRQFT